MTCEKKGRDCSLLFKSGCAFGDAGCSKIVEQCEGCNKIAQLIDGEHCRCYAKPEAQWKSGNCNMASHVKAESAKAAKINPLKASKRAKNK